MPAPVMPEPASNPPVISRMSPIELRNIADKILTEMRQEDIATMLDVHERTMRRWLKGDAEINGSATALLRLLRAGKLTLNDIRQALAQRPDMS